MDTDPLTRPVIDQCAFHSVTSIQLDAIWIQENSLRVGDGVDDRDIVSRHIEVAAQGKHTEAEGNRVKQGFLGREAVGID